MVFALRWGSAPRGKCSGLVSFWLRASAAVQLRRLVELGANTQSHGYHRLFDREIMNGKAAAKQPETSFTWCDLERIPRGCEMPRKNSVISSLATEERSREI